MVYENWHIYQWLFTELFGKGVYLGKVWETKLEKNNNFMQQSNTMS